MAQFGAAGHGFEERLVPAVVVAAGRLAAVLTAAVVAEIILAVAPDG